MDSALGPTGRQQAKSEVDAALRLWREAFVAWRRNLGSQDAAATLIGVTQGTVSAWETAAKEPKMRFALLIERLSGGKVQMPSVVLDDDDAATDFDNASPPRTGTEG